MRIVETDNFGGDYPDEKFLNLPNMQETHANKVCAAINDALASPESRRYWKVVKNNYVLRPGFEP